MSIRAWVSLLSVASVTAVMLSVGAKPALAQNLTVNPHFDGGTAVPWTGTFGFDPTVDDTGTPGSGSGKVNITSSDGLNELVGGPSQCFTLLPGAVYSASENVFTSSANPAPDTALLAVGWYTDPSCTFADFISNNHAQTSTQGSWVSLSLSGLVPPAGAQSLLVAGELEWPGNGTHVANFDDILLSQVGGVPAVPPGALLALAAILLMMAAFARLRPRHAR